MAPAAGRPRLPSLPGDHALGLIAQRLGARFGGGSRDPPGISWVGSGHVEQGLLGRWSAGIQQGDSATGVAWVPGRERKGGWPMGRAVQAVVRPSGQGKPDALEGFDHFVGPT